MAGTSPVKKMSKCVIAASRKKPSMKAAPKVPAAKSPPKLRTPAQVKKVNAMRVAAKKVAAKKVAAKRAKLIRSQPACASKAEKRAMGCKTC